METSRQLSRDEIKALLDELGDYVTAVGLEVHLRLVGGAALILLGLASRMTADIDAVPPHGSESWARWPEVEAAVTEIARRHGLDQLWLNRGAGVFIPANAVWEPYMSREGLTVETASVETLLSMKLVSGRWRDSEDLWRLMAEAGV